MYQNSIDKDMERFTSILANQELSAIEKFNLLFLLNGNKPQDVVEVVEHSMRNSNSIFDYRAKELSKEHTIPIIVEVIQQGIKEGIFQTAYPEEISEFCYVLATSLFDSLSKDVEMECLEKKVEAFFHTISQLLNIHVAQLEQAKESMLQQIRTYERREK